MSDTDLTPRQTEILRLIQRTVQETGMPPTRKEISTELGFRSANSAEEHLRALARKGVISLLPGASRGIQLKDALREQMGLPLIGRVAASHHRAAPGRVQRSRWRNFPQLRHRAPARVKDAAAALQAAGSPPA